MCFACFVVFPVVVIWLNLNNRCSRVSNKKQNGEELKVVKIEHESLCETETYIVDKF